MPITTSPSPAYVVRMLGIGIVCIVLSVWGAYDLWVKIPNREEIARRYEQASVRVGELERTRDQRPLSSEEAAAMQAANDELRAVTPGGKAPVMPSKFDRAIQWVYILCMPWGLWALWQLRHARTRYLLDERGDLHFTADPERGDGAWTAADMADIDMSRWMAKSIARVVHRDGQQRLKLDAYVHKRLEEIVGALANRFQPGKWDDQVRPMKEPADPADDGQADADEGTTSESAAAADQRVGA